MTKYGRSPWIDECPKSRVPSHPRHRGPLKADVVIVGGGLTGCATAYACAAAGRSVVLLEADQLGRGTTAFASGWLAEDPGISFQAVEKLIGLRAARHGFQAWRRAALDFAALIRRLNIKCAFEPHPSATISTTNEQLQRLKREQKARRDAGLDAPLLNARAASAELGLPATAAIRYKDGGTLDPYRACLGLAAAAQARGARIFEHTLVRRISFNRKIADVHTPGGAIRATRVVIATGAPTALFKALARHFWFKSTFLVLTEPVPAKIRRQLGARATVLCDSAEPAHVVRWVGEDRLLIVGADSMAPPPRLRDRTLVQRTGQLMYELSTLYPDISGIQPAYGWDAPYALTAEGLPYVGPHRSFPHQLFAFGDASRSVTGSYLASRILLRYVLDEVESADEAFSFNR